MTSEIEFLQAYESIKLSFRSAMSQVDTAIGLEEQDRTKEAIIAYEESLLLIASTFAIPVGLPDEIDDIATEWTDACALIQKLKTAKTEITYRIKVLRAQIAPIDNDAEEASEGNYAHSDLVAGSSDTHRPLLMENPSTYYEINNAGGNPKTYLEILGALREVIATADSGVQFDTLFQAQVKLYKIHANGEVSTMAGDTSMSLVMCNNDAEWKFLNGIIFVQCAIPDELTNVEGGAAAPLNMIWIYPLIHDVISFYKTSYGAFIFPDMESTTPGNAFGIMLSRSSTSQSLEEVEQLEDLQQFFSDLLEAILGVTLPIFVCQGPEIRGHEVSKSIVNFADFVARNMIRGAEKTGALMIRTTPFLISKLEPAPADAPQVPSTIQTSVQVAQKVTHCAVGLTGWVAGKVGSASVAIGNYLAPHVRTHGSNILQKGFGYNSYEANSTMEGAMTIAAGAVEGISTVYNGLETSAKILGTNLSTNSVKIIEHKYGTSAGNVAAGTFDTFGNAFVVSQNVNYVTPKGIAKKLVKKTGAQLLQDYKRCLRIDESHVVAGSLYPDLRLPKEKTL